MSFGASLGLSALLATTLVAAKAPASMPKPHYKAKPAAITALQTAGTLSLVRRFESALRTYNITAAYALLAPSIRRHLSLAIFANAASRLAEPPGVTPDGAYVRLTPSSMKAILGLVPLPTTKAGKIAIPPVPSYLELLFIASNTVFRGAFWWPRISRRAASTRMLFGVCPL